LIFPEGMLYNKKKHAVRTPGINALFAEIHLQVSDLEEKENGNPGENCHFTSSVPRTSGSSNFLLKDLAAIAEF